MPDYNPHELTILDDLRSRFNRLFPEQQELSQLMLFRLSYGEVDGGAEVMRSMRWPLGEVVLFGGAITSNKKRALCT